MNKGNRQLPTKWALRFWLQRLRAKHDAKRGTDAVQKRINAMFAVADAYVHQRCAAFLDEKHALFVEVAAYTPPHKQTTTTEEKPMPEAAEKLSIVQRKAAAAAKAAAVQAERHAHEQAQSKQEELAIYVKELSEEIEFFMNEAAASANGYLTKIADVLNLGSIKNPFETYEFQPRQYNIVMEGGYSNEEKVQNSAQ